MKVTLTKSVEFTWTAFRLVAQIRYVDEDAPDGMFGLKGETLELTVDLLDDGKAAKIRGWKGPAIDLHSKVCDCCSVYLMGPEGTTFAEREDNYVPDFFPGDHYGDYLILNIDASGTITNWKKPKLAEVCEQFGNE